MGKRPQRKVRTPRAKKTTPTRSARDASSANTSKLDRIVAALRAPKGAALSDLMALTGWQAHSVCGALSGALKKERGLSIISSKTGAERIYRIASGK